MTSIRSAMHSIIAAVRFPRTAVLLTAIVFLAPAGRAQIFLDLVGDATFADIAEVSTSREELGRTFTVTFSGIDLTQSDFGFLIDLNFDTISSGFAHTWTGFESDYRLLFNSAYSRDSLRLVSHVTGVIVDHLGVELSAAQATVRLPDEFLANEEAWLAFGVQAGSLAEIGHPLRSEVFAIEDALPAIGDEPLYAIVPEPNAAVLLAGASLVAVGAVRWRRRQRQKTLAR